MIPPRSPYSLIQEDLWPNEWKILVSCILLNCTTRKQVEKVMPRLFQLCPDAASMSVVDKEPLARVIAPLGFKNKRSSTLISMSKAYLKGGWTHAKELPGVGEYAAAAWEIFVKRSMPSMCPKDHALTLWWKWHQRHRASSRMATELPTSSPTTGSWSTDVRRGGTVDRTEWVAYVRW